MNKHFKNIVLESTKATDLFEINKIQDLWSGYGVIMRYGLVDSPLKTVIVKHVRLPTETDHPRGWNTDLSHDRKVKSYKVETAWYSKWSSLCNNDCHVPKCYAFESQENEILIVLEDLNSTGYEARKTSVSLDEIKVCLKWLASFHATFLGKTPENLWEIGTYWHLDTRPDEWDVLDDKELKSAAKAIDMKLRDSTFQTFVHGDAKLANFCFSRDGKNVAAVDFQYVGGGCGMKDVAYFIGSCLYEDECEELESELLDYYFSVLKRTVIENQKGFDFQSLESEWRKLYPVAWTDFHRFIKGWSPGHWKINSYSERLSKEVIKNI